MAPSLDDTKCVYEQDIIELDGGLRLPMRSRRKLERIYRDVMKEVVFSRFKYYTSHRVVRDNGGIPDSKYGIRTFKEGNCVAFAYYTQSVLRKHGFTKAVVVGSSPPKLFKRPGYKHVSHAAVVLPYNRGYVLFDASFYYPRPVYVDLKRARALGDTASTVVDTLDVKNVYSGGTEKWYFEYVSPESTDAYDASGGTVPMGTPYIRASFDVYEYPPPSTTDECRYYLRELKNADSCITVHTNAADRRIFYCKVTPDLDIELYYAFDLNTPNHFRLKGRVRHGDIPSLSIVPGTTTRGDVERWTRSPGFPTSGREYRKMRANLLTFFDRYIDASRSTPTRGDASMEA